MDRATAWSSSSQRSSRTASTSEKSGGGVTLSGGEPTLQAGFAVPLLRALQEKGVHTALDTCGQAAWNTLEAHLPHADLEASAASRGESIRSGTRNIPGRPMHGSLENLVKLGSFMRERGTPRALWIRTPLIPGCFGFNGKPQGHRFVYKGSLGSLVRAGGSSAAFSSLLPAEYEVSAWTGASGMPACSSRRRPSTAAAATRGSGVDARVVHLSGPLELESAHRCRTGTTCAECHQGEDPHETDRNAL